MEDKKTNMLTVEQFNAEGQINKSNSLGFAIGVPEKIELEFEGISIDDSFTRRLAEYGMIVKKVDSLEALKGKTGFIVYGFYNMQMGFAGMTYTEKRAFHIVRMNPDGTLVHKEDATLPAKHIKLLNSKGGIEGYNEENEPITIFSLEEERYADRDAIRTRADGIVSRIKKILDNPVITHEEKEDIKSRIMAYRQIANESTVTSNVINIMLQRIDLISRRHMIILGDNSDEGRKQ